MHYPIHPVCHTPFQTSQITRHSCQIFCVTDNFFIENLGQFRAILLPKVVFQELNHVLKIPKLHIKRHIAYSKDHLFTVINVFYLVSLFFEVFHLNKIQDHKSVYMLFAHLYSINPDKFKDLALIISEILQFIELHSYEFVLLYIL